MPEFTHLDENGNVQMVDISFKPPVHREAVASGKIYLQEETMQQINEGTIIKGNVLTTAKIAGIHGAKLTSQLIPLCHQIHLTKVDLTFKMEKKSIEITASVICTARTGPELEALNSVMIAALTIYDMCKAIDKEMSIGEIKVCHKSKTSA